MSALIPRDFGKSNPALIVAEVNIKALPSHNAAFSIADWLFVATLTLRVNALNVGTVLNRFFEMLGL